jgi:hypothetical protein
MRFRSLVIAGALVASLVSEPAATQSPSPPGAELYFIEPADGATVDGPVRVVFGLRGMGVAPALVDWPNTGHHHLLVNRPLTPPGLPIPNDPAHLHFGGGQTETTLTLPAGRHTLQLVLGDHNHVPHVPPVVSRPITITVR